MKRWIKKTELLVGREILLLMRTRKGSLLMAVTVVLGIFSQLIEYLTGAREQIPTCPEVLFTGYSTFLQLFPLALTIVLADAISGEIERGTWNFIKSKPFSRGQFLASKMLANYLAVTIAVTLMWAGVVLFAYMAAGKNCSWKCAGLAWLLIQAVSFAIVALEIMVSAASTRTATAVLVTIIVWLIFTIVNIATPIGRGFIAPWAVNSYQTSVIVRYLGLGFPVVPFEQLAGMPSSAEVWKAVLIPLMEGAVFCGIARIAFQRQ